MSQSEKKQFLKKMTVLVDTREKENAHILEKLDEWGVAYDRQKLDYGDYSFVVDGKDFRQSCVIERKASVDEIYGNIMQQRERFEKEMAAASVLAGSLTLIIENCADEKALKETVLKDSDFYKSPKRQVSDIGKFVYSTVRAWELRYNFRFRCVADKNDTAAEILECFYWHWHNYKKLTAPLRRKP